MLVISLWRWRWRLNPNLHFFVLYYNKIRFSSVLLLKQNSTEEIVVGRKTVLEGYEFLNFYAFGNGIDWIKLDVDHISGNIAYYKLYIQTVNSDKPFMTLEFTLDQLSLLHRFAKKEITLDKFNCHCEIEDDYIEFISGLESEPRSFVLYLTNKRERTYRFLKKETEARYPFVFKFAQHTADGDIYFVKPSLRKSFLIAFLSTPLRDKIFSHIREEDMADETDDEIKAKRVQDDCVIM